METTAMMQHVFIDGNFDAFPYGYNSQGDPELGIARTFVSAAIGQPNGNASRYSNPKIDELFEKAAVAPTHEERGRLYKEAQRLLSVDLPILTLHEQREYDAQTVALKGLEEEDFLPTWRDAWLDR